MRNAAINMKLNCKMIVFAMEMFHVRQHFLLISASAATADVDMTPFGAMNR